MSRQLLRLIAGTLIGFLMFAQMAIAAYACPVLTQPQKQMLTVALVNDNAVLPAAVDQKVNCEDMAAASMDPDNANLCAAHCQFGQRNHQASTLTVPVALFVALYVNPPTLVTGSALRPTATAKSALVAASPPHTILHCCFRI